MMLYFLLIAGWVFFYAMHSILALDSMKAFVKNLFQSYFPYYRIGYNVFSVLLFVALVYYQFSLSQELVVAKSIVLEVLGAIVFLLGVIVLNVAFSSFNKREFIGLEQLDEIKQPTSYSRKETSENRFVRLRSTSFIFWCNTYVVRRSFVFAECTNAFIRNGFVGVFADRGNIGRTKISS
jgi:hypothetical protein